MTRTQTPDVVSDKHEFDQSLISAIHEASPDGILVVSHDDMIVSHNQRLFDVFGIAPEKIPGQRDGVLNGLPDRPLLSRVLELVKDQDAFLQRVQALYGDPLLEDRCEIELNDGRTLERHSKALWGANRRYLGRVWFFRDITDRKQVEQALLEMSQKDPLTGVANRRFFYERVAEEFARARRFGRSLSFVMLDIDHFKQINDRWGHATGDKVLKNLGDSVQNMLRQVDVFARIGGEEFAVLGPDTDLEGAYSLAERVRRGVEAQTVVEGNDTITYTISAGVATLVPEDATFEVALARADKALYAAKRSGRNRTSRENAD